MAIRINCEPGCRIRAAIPELDDRGDDLISAATQLTIGDPSIAEQREKLQADWEDLRKCCERWFESPNLPSKKERCSIQLVLKEASLDLFNSVVGRFTPVRQQVLRKARRRGQVY